MLTLNEPARYTTWWWPVLNYRDNGWWFYLKWRFVDVVVAGVAMIVFLPLMLVIIIMIWLSGSRQVFVERKDSSGFRRLTFNNDGACIGRFLQWTALRDLPQIVQVLKGEMTLVERANFKSRNRREGRRRDPDGWLQTSGFLIPKKYREPMLGDLIEDRAEMRSKGLSNFRIEAVTIVQLLVACACRPKVWISAVMGWLARTFAS